MIQILDSGLVSSSLLVLVFTAGLAAGWIILRLRNYRSANRSNSVPSLAPPLEAGFLEGLLCDEDFVFLASLPGYKAEIGKRLRNQRVRIFRMYLRDIAREFHAVHALARQLASNSGEESASIVGQLMWQELQFWRTMFRIELGLTIRQPALRSSLAGLLEMTDIMRREMARCNSLVPQNSR